VDCHTGAPLAALRTPHSAPDGPSRCVVAPSLQVAAGAVTLRDRATTPGGGRDRHAAWPLERGAWPSRRVNLKIPSRSYPQNLKIASRGYPQPVDKPVDNSGRSDADATLPGWRALRGHAATLSGHPSWANLEARSGGFPDRRWWADRIIPVADRGSKSGHLPDRPGRGPDPRTSPIARHRAGTGRSENLPDRRASSEPAQADRRTDVLRSGRAVWSD